MNPKDDRTLHEQDDDDEQLSEWAKSAIKKAGAVAGSALMVGLTMGSA